MTLLDRSQPCLHRDAFRFVPTVLAVTLFALAPSTALAAKLHCRNLSFSGTGGCGRQDIVRFRALDAQGNVVHQSCDVQVQGLESATTFAARLPRDLGSYPGCAFPTPQPTTPPTKMCLNGSGPSAGSCKYKWKAKKQVLEVCCWQGPDCKGVKLGNYCDAGSNLGKKCSANSECPGGSCNMRTGTTGLSLQKQIQGTDPDFGPTPVPITNAEAVFVNVDPISMTQLPFPNLSKCRVNLGKAMRNLASTIVHVLVKCHQAEMSGELISDCNSVNFESDPNEAVDVAREELFDEAATCAPSGSPFDLGYGTCPPPCAGIVVSRCSAGTINAPCTNHADCGPGGKCGGSQDWGPAADCMACLAQSVIETVVEDKYGTVGAGLSATDENCQNGIGKTLAFLVDTHVAQTVKCQKLIDAGKAALPFCVAGQCTAPPSRAGLSCQGDDDCNPPENRLCKNADPSGGRKLAEQKAAELIGQECIGTDFSMLDTCGGDVPSEQLCVILNGRAVNNAIADIVYPEGVGHTPCDPCPTPTPMPTPTP